MKRLAPLVIAALAACSNSPTALDLSALDLSGRWTLLDSATAVQVDTDRVYATVVARGTVVLTTLGPRTYTVTESFPLHFTLIDSTARLTMYEDNSAGLVQDTVFARGDSLFGLTPDPIVAPPATISATKISLQESRVDPATTDPNAMGCGRAVSLFTRLGSAPHPSSCRETLLLVKVPCDTPVVVKAKTDGAGVREERAWLNEHYPGHGLYSQALSDHKGHPVDILEFQTADGRHVSVCFDITASFGHF